MSRHCDEFRRIDSSYIDRPLDKSQSQSTTNAKSGSKSAIAQDWQTRSQNLLSCVGNVAGNVALFAMTPVRARVLPHLTTAYISETRLPTLLRQLKVCTKLGYKLIIPYNCRVNTMSQVVKERWLVETVISDCRNSSCATASVCACITDHDCRRKAAGGRFAGKPWV